MPSVSLRGSQLFSLLFELLVHLSWGDSTQLHWISWHQLCGRCHYSMCASARGPIDTNFTLWIYINNQMDPYCIKRTLSRRKRGANDHSFDRLPWQFCLFPKWICTSVPQCVTVMPLWRYTLQAKRKENCQTKAFCPAACWSDLTHSLQGWHNSVLAWMVWKPKIGIPVTQAHLRRYFPQIPSRLATAHIHFNGKPVQVKLHHDEDLPSSWRVLSHRTIEQYKQHQTKSKNIQPALPICNKSYQSWSYQPFLKVHTGNIKQQYVHLAQLLAKLRFVLQRILDESSALNHLKCQISLSFFFTGERMSKGGRSSQSAIAVQSCGSLHLWY